MLAGPHSRTSPLSILVRLPYPPRPAPTPGACRQSTSYLVQCGNTPGSDGSIAFCNQPNCVWQNVTQERDDEGLRQAVGRHVTRMLPHNRARCLAITHSLHHRRRAGNARNGPLFFKNDQCFSLTGEICN